MLPFSKYSGCGNDFLLFDNRFQLFPAGNKALIARLCHRQRGVGADGIILLENSLTADFKMRIFNSDGSEAEMCGNGIRCLMKFIQELGFADEKYVVETMNERIPLFHENDEISVKMPSPTEISWSTPLSLNGNTWKIHFLNTGVPHAVIFVGDVLEVDLETIAPKIRFHPQFAPKGTNVNFVALHTHSQKIFLRTYERGVEQETLACGTGAVASAIAAAKIHGITSPIHVQTKSQECLKIAFHQDAESVFSNIIMTGPATFVFSGKIDLNRTCALDPSTSHLTHLMPRQ